MPYFEPDQESVERAAALSSLLMNDLRAVAEEGPQKDGRKVFSERRYSEQTEGVPITDVIATIRQMATEFALARRWYDEIPCLKLDDGELAPISIAEFFGSTSPPIYGGSLDWLEYLERYGPLPLHRLWRDIVHNSLEGEERLVVASVAEAEERVGHGLRGFLSYRFAGIKVWTKWARGKTSLWRFARSVFGGGIGVPRPLSAGPGGGLQIQVSCLTPGLRIHVSPAYFINWVYFGSPTTPVSSYILPGRYVFSGDGPMLPRRTKDHAVFAVPPTYHVALTRF